MDPITHGIAGGILGKGFFSAREKRVAVFASVLGAVAPDVDVFYQGYAEIVQHDPLAIVKYHRAITHSFIALPFFAILLALIVRAGARYLKIESPSLGKLTLVSAVGLASHILLDGTTSFGTRMWYPISSQRVAWDWLFIIDFVFTSLILIPQLLAGIYRDTPANREKAFARVIGSWLLLSIGTIVVWRVAASVGTPFHGWIVAFVSLIFGALFFLPLQNGWGFRVQSHRWCQAGACLALAYILACGWMHHTAIVRAQYFAAENHIAVERIGALPIPPSFLDWGDAIRTPNGVYQSQFDLRQARPAGFRFIPDSPHDAFVSRAVNLPEVEQYWNFARFPSIQSFSEDGDRVVEFGEDRFVNGRRGASSPFTYRVEFDSSGEVVEQGFQTNAMSMRELIRMKPARSKATE